MADPRRSARSTKGVNSRLSELNVIEPATPVPKRRKSTPKSVVDESAAEDTTAAGKSDDIIRCVCGANEEDEDDDRMMIQCEGCDAWQHTQCMGIQKKKIPKEYFCEVCQPDRHVNLLEQMTLGEKPWEKKRGGKRKPAPAKPKESTPATTPARDNRRASIVTEKAKGKVSAPVTPAAPKPKAASPPATAKKGTKRGSKKVVEKEAEKEVEKDTAKDGVKVAEEEMPKHVTKASPKDVTEEAPLSQEDKMDIDSAEPHPSLEPVSPPTLPESGPIEPPGTGEQQLDRTDRDATIPMEDIEMPPPPAPPAEAPPPKSPTKSLPPIVTDATSAPSTKGPKDTSEKAMTPKTPKSAKRKQSAESDGEHKADEDKEQQHPEKKQRRVSSAAAQTPEPTPRRKSSSVTTKPPPKPKQQSDTTPQLELVNTISELRNSNRVGVANYLMTCLTPHAKRLFDEKKITLQPGSTVDSLVENRALQIEHHVYVNNFDGGKITEQYQKRSKSIAFNLKGNASLSDKILCGQLSCERLSHMTTEEMAKKELQEFMQQVRMQSEKHNTLINETGPRIRRTHKGEELVSEDNAPSAQDTLLDSGLVIRRPSETIDEAAAHAAPMSPVVQSPAQPTETSISPPPVATTSEPPRSPSQPSPAEGSAPPAALEKKTFNIEKVWRNVESPDTSARPRLPSVSHPPPSAPPHPQNMNIDKDIDIMLKDDDAGTPPYSPASDGDHYSPKADHEDDGSMWHGKLEMNGIPDLQVRATLLGGPERIGSKRWLELIDPVLNIDGRIKYERATEYLCGQKFSKSSTMIIASLTPENAAHQHDFDKLFYYFKSKERYAVVGKNSLECIKDLYIVPVDKDEKLPDWFSVVDPSTTSVAAKVVESGKSPQKMLVLNFVVIRSLVEGAATNTTPQQQQQQAIVTPPQHQQQATPPAPQQQQQQQLAPFQPPVFQQYPPFPQQYQYPNHNHNNHHSAPPPPPSHENGNGNANGNGNGNGNGYPHPPPAPYIPQHAMTRELSNLIPKLGDRQARAIDELLYRNPELQMKPDVLAMEVERVLGGA